MTQLWEVQEAIQKDTESLRNQIMAAAIGQPVTDISAEACRFALILRGEEITECRRS